MSLIRSDAALAAIEEAVCANAGDLTRACRDLAINPRELHQWCLADPEIANSIRTAQLIGYASLESEAYRRAVKGIQEDVYYQGEVVGQKTVYSDGLLTTMLKARVPGYGSDDSGASRVTVNVNLMPRAETYEEWLEHRDSALALTDQTAIPAEEVIDAEYVVHSALGGLRDVL